MNNWIYALQLGDLVVIEWEYDFGYRHHTIAKVTLKDSHFNEFYVGRIPFHFNGVMAVDYTKAHLVKFQEDDLPFSHLFNCIDSTILEER
jgi:hypothetical protein